MSSLLVCLLVILTIAKSAITHDFITNGPDLPRADCCMATGYYNGVITMIGGETGPLSLIEYDINEGTFTQPSEQLPTSVGLKQYNHFWVQHSVNVYIINPTGTALQKYDLSTKTLTNDWSADMPTTVRYTACIAYAHDVLYVMGGGHRDNEALDTVQRYVVISSQWLATKAMQTQRYDFACLYSPANDALYAIGGSNVANKDLNTVEYIAIADVESGYFAFTQNTLTTDLVGMFAVAYGADIFILGGTYCFGSCSDIWQYANDIHILDTSTNTISRSPHKLAYAVGYTAGTLVNNTIYLFGGFLSGGYLTLKWQFYDLPEIETTTTTTAMTTTTTESTMDDPATSEQRSNGDSIMPMIAALMIGITVSLMCCVCLLWRWYCKTTSKNEEQQEDDSSCSVVPQRAPSVQMWPSDSHSHVQMQPLVGDGFIQPHVPVANAHSMHMQQPRPMMVAPAPVVPNRMNAGVFQPVGEHGHDDVLELGEEGKENVGMVRVTHQTQDEDSFSDEEKEEETMNGTMTAAYQESLPINRNHAVDASVGHSLVLTPESNVLSVLK